MDEPRVIGERYELLELIDQGGMGKVYRGRDRSTGETIAVKELKADLAGDPQSLARFAREAETLRKLEHPNIVKVHATISEGAQHYIVMDFVGGGSLAHLLRQSSPLPIRQAIEIALQLTDALAYVHRANIIHRDIKPENVLLTEDGIPRLTDFGVALLADQPHLTRAGVLVGTFAYLSPEACREEPLDARADIWSFGIMFYEMLAGRRPFDASHSAAILTAILHDPVPPITQFRPEVSPELADLIGRMLTKERDQRVSVIRSIGAALETLLAGELPSGAQVVPVPAPPAATGPQPMQTVLVSEAEIDADERAHLEDLREIHLKNIRHLETQAARHGQDVPLDVLNDLDFQRGELQKVEEQLGIYRPPAEEQPETPESTESRQTPQIPSDETSGEFAAPEPPASPAGAETPAPQSAAPAAPAAQPAGTVTFLFTDIEGSTRLWERHRQTMPGALSRHAEILEHATAGYAGYTFNKVGDSFCVAFSSAAAALSAAVAAQRALIAEEWGDVGAIHVRMALHTGEAIVRDGDYFGPSLNRAARLLAAGYGDQILLSSATADLARESMPPDTGLRDLGQHQLRDLMQPEHIFQLLASGLPDAFPPLKTVNRRPTNLPLQPSAFVGREQEIATVVAFLRRPDVRLLTLTGPGGIGKTRLAFQVAADLLDEYADGVYAVNLAPVGDAKAVTASIARALDVAETPEQPLEQALRAHLAERRTLLIMDNFEQVVAAAPLVADLINSSAFLKVLVTSRESLHLSIEQVYAVPPLALPDPRYARSVDDLAQCAAVELFVERALRVQPDFSVTRANAAAIAEICVRLDGLPLAIELAAARIVMFPPKAMLKRLIAATGQPALEFLISSTRDREVRQQTLRAALDWSYDLLTPNEQQLFRRLSVFVGGRTLAAIQTVCYADDDPARREAERLIESLIDKSLLRAEPQAEDEPRFVMLKTIHAYGQDRLVESGEAELLRRRHAEYFLALAEEAEPMLTGLAQGDWLSRLERESGNLQTALQWALDRSAGELLARLGGALWRFWYTRGNLAEGRQWLEAARRMLNAGAGSSMASDATTLAPIWQAKVLSGLGSLAWAQGDAARAEADCQAALTMYRELGDRTAIASLINRLGAVAVHQGDYARAREHYTESLALYRELNDSWGIANALGNLGAIAQIQNDIARAQSCYSESLDLRRRLKDQRGIALMLNNLGEVALMRHEYAQAEACYAECVELCEALGDAEGLAYCLKNMGSIAASQGQPERAAMLWGAAETLRAAIGAPLLPADQEAYARALDEARAQCDPAAWDAALTSGRGLRLEHAIDLALGRPPRGRPPASDDENWPDEDLARHV